MKHKLVLLIILLFVIGLIPSNSLSQENAQERKESIIVDGDKVESFFEDKQVVAEGNVIITYQGATLTCDKIKVNTQTKDALAEGNVHLVYPKGEIKGEKVEYNFAKMTGRIIDGSMKTTPYFGKGEVIDRVSENEFLIKRGFITTCDLDKPHYRLQSKRVAIFPGDKVVAKDMVFKLGKIPLFYLPKFTQRLDEKRPHVRVVPGKDKEWGYFVLQAWRYDFNQSMHGRVHLDYREKRDFASGFDNYFDTPLLGQGVFRTYYTNERKIQSEHLYEVPRNTKEKERFRIQLLQTKQIKDDTNMVLQFNRMKDDNFIKDYFFREYEKDYKPDSYLLLTQSKPYHSLSLLVRKRFNRYFAETERLPEFKLVIPSFRIGSFNNDSSFDSQSDSKGIAINRMGNLYFKSEATSSNLENKGAAPSDLKNKIYRFDTYNELSYQKKVAFIETNPYLAFRGSYFGRDANRKEDIWRNVYYSGIDLSTKFYRLFNVNHESLFVQFNNLRHIITPTISYQYIRKPSVISSTLIQYDDIDSINKKSNLTLSLENKLQTKRENNTVDFLRFIVDSSYLFKHEAERGGRFSNINFDFEFLPHNWIRIDADSVYDRDIEKFSSVNLDMYIHDTASPERWYLGIGKRYGRKSSNQITTDLYFRPNDKWKFRIYERFYPHSQFLVEQGYTVTRDLHCWEVEVNYEVRRGQGETLWFIFRIKAFPEMEFDWGKEYHRRKPGSQ